MPDELIDPTPDVIERLARCRAAKADPTRTMHPAIAAMAAGAGAKLVADQNKARTILAERIHRARARREQAGSGSRPETPPLPVTSTPAGESRRCASTQAGDPR